MSDSQPIGPYDITFSLKPGASAEDAVYLHEQVKAHPYAIDSEMSVADFAGECDRLRAENEALKRRLKVMAREVSERLDWIVRDRSEPDKVLANVSTARSVLIRELALASDEQEASDGR